MAQRSIADLFRAIYADGDKAYRAAVAAQVVNENPEEAWDTWQNNTAALLLISWAAGAHASLYTAKVKVQKPAKPVTFDRDMPDFLLRFEGGAAKQVVQRYMDLLPITRERWVALVDYAFQAAGEMRSDEAATALLKMVDRSPELAKIIFPAAAGAKPKPVPGMKAVVGLPEEVKQRRTPGVQTVVQGTFFVTGMNQRQIESVRNLLAKTIKGEVTTSVAGKKLLELGVGDFVQQSVIATGTDLTAARLETVYRTNLNRAQTQGRLDICRDDTVKAFVPVMQFRATKDKRTRPTHKAMHGYVATVEQIDNQGIPAPLGFNCRCSWAPVSLFTAVSNGWATEDGRPNYDGIRKHNGQRQRLIDSGAVPDPGFISG
jgi:SPP1 gp7 family putative phage head morphogenesis protein